MRIYFIRHAEAVEADEFEGNDLQRPLTRAGRKQAAAAFRHLVRYSDPLERIISSEALRACETADILRAVSRKSKRVISSHFNPGGAINGFRLFIKPLRRHNTTIAIVGHEPDLSRIVSRLVASGKLDMRLKKGAIAEVEMDVSGRGVLRSLLPPAALTGGK